jgi:hypothetical protein
MRISFLYSFSLKATLGRYVTFHPPLKMSESYSVQQQANTKPPSSTSYTSGKSMPYSLPSSDSTSADLSTDVERDNNYNVAGDHAKATLADKQTRKSAGRMRFDGLLRLIPSPKKARDASEGHGRGTSTRHIRHEARAILNQATKRRSKSVREYISRVFSRTGRSPKSKAR